MKHSRRAIAVSMLLAVQPCCLSLALANPNTDNLIAQGAASGEGITNYNNGDSAPPAPKVNTENWPWMNKEKPKVENAEQFKTEKLQVEKVEKPVLDQGQLLKPEAAVSAPSSGASSVSVMKPPPVRAVSNKPFKLYGRIDQLAGSAGASFPVLKPMTAKLDARGIKPLQARATDSVYSGNIVRSFPTNYSGTWGGNLQLSQLQITQLYYSNDPETARRTAQALHVGAIGQTNFQFANFGQTVSLEPAKVLLMVPMKDTVQGDSIGGAAGAGNPFGALMGQMAQGMNVPLTFNFGDVNTSGSPGQVSVTGGQQRTNVIKNTIRQLGPGVMEQQIVTQETNWDPHNGQAHSGYGETVIRFTARNAQQMYVEAASINYSGAKQFEMKVVFRGWVTKGVVVNTDPMAAMGGLGGGMGGLGNLQQMMGGQAGKAGGATPQIPGFDPNMLKNLFGQ